MQGRAYLVFSGLIEWQALHLLNTFLPISILPAPSAAAGKISVLITIKPLSTL